MMLFSSPWQLLKNPKMLDLLSIHIWSANINDLRQRLAAFKTSLNTAELIRAEKYVFEHDRQRFILARGFLRALLGEYLQIDAKQIIFDYSKYGKPKITDEQNHLNIHFNVSDSKDLVLIAIGKQNLGVDLEYIRQNLDIQGMAKNFFSANEYQKLIATAKDQQYKMFFTLWTRKEAVIKNMGLGLSYPTQEIEVLEEITKDNKGNEYKIFTVPISASYEAALATNKNTENENISYFNWKE